jgi:L-threonylcarbamoyladenylate synthase
MARNLLQQGQLVAIPTETVYGLAANALNADAVANIFRVKNRPSFDPLIVHVPSLEAARPYVLQLPDAALRLASAFMPGPLTLLLPRSPLIPDLVTSGLERVAIRVPAHPLCLELLQTLDFPLAAPSANPFGYISPTSPEHVAAQLGEQIPYILDGGPCQVGVESTIVGFENDIPTVYRKGGLSLETLEALAGPLQVREHSSSNPAAPGMLHTHYAPRTPIVLGQLERLLEQHAGKRLGLLSFSRAYPQVPEARQVQLSPGADYNEAARNLFAAMRQLDSLQLDLIVAELLPEVQLGRAINDRLRRAAVS